MPPPNLANPAFHPPLSSYAAPEDEVKPTRFVDGRLSSTTVNFTLKTDEILVGVQGKVHSTERLYTDMVFVTNQGRKFICRSATRSDTSVRNVKFDRNMLENVSFSYDEKRKYWGRKDSAGDDGTTGILGLRAAIVTTSGNMMGVAALSCNVTKFLHVDEGDVAGEWTDEEMESIKRMEQMKRAQELEILSKVEANKVKNNVFLEEANGDDGVVKETFWNLKLKRSHSTEMEEDKILGERFISYEEKARRREMEENARSNRRVDWGEWARGMEDEESEDGGKEDDKVWRGTGEINEWDMARKYMMLDPHVAKQSVSLVPDGSLSFYDNYDEETNEPSVRDFLRFALDDPTTFIQDVREISNVP